MFLCAEPKEKLTLFIILNHFFRIPDAALYIHILLRYTDDDILYNSSAFASATRGDWFEAFRYADMFVVSFFTVIHSLQCTDNKHLFHLRFYLYTNILKSKTHL